ncbi:hypothetical protein FXE87_06055 [Vibrio mimicus]|uniref:Uncharacterized protein n=1 Tax=Vibrio mimicus TaxID=674 RepID=A0A1D8S7J4_VIBMI|nr:hypothetical protein VM_00560 [Vibrio mimicus]EEY39942.1 hypothetical protein VII_003712 [Vibrio mimicus MB451]EEY46560.1 hypothetical protein VMA_000121 [Vibrio mimicus VM223]EGU17922.1 hypothetical protein SX4_1331 [Vibrio mimicus SX-4]EMB49494.1 hypothetical protein D908_13322 [Vibrio mimicus CAIM 602]ERM63228.1 hypothetical protein P781_00600 [Vibrio mimicus CAIM 1883]ERM63422.1 hypothetical protein P780_00590 [Vibrio mimicus CAIM 1882]
MTDKSRFLVMFYATMPTKRDQFNTSLQFGKALLEAHHIKLDTYQH